MLKIKDDIDLKELEKYGYKLEEDWWNRAKGDFIYYKHVAPYTSIEIEVNTKMIFQNWEDIYVSVKEEYINDLIKDGLVIKVDD